MQRMVWVAVAAFGLMLGCATTPAARQEQGTPSTSAQGVASSDGSAQAQATPEETDPLVCEDVMVTGSRLPKQVCRKKSQIRREREEAQKYKEDMPRVNPTP